MAEEVRRGGIHHQEGRAIAEVERHQQQADGRQRAKVVQVLEVGLVVGRLVLGDGIDEGVARLGVLHEQRADAGGDGDQGALGHEEDEEDDAPDGAD